MPAHRPLLAPEPSRRLAVLVAVVALHQAERQQTDLRAQLAEATRPVARPDAAAVRAERGYLADWQGLLRGHVQQAQQVLRRLIAGRLTFTPRGKHYEFRGAGTVQPLLAGSVRKLASPRGREGTQSDGASLRAMASPICASWNQLKDWLRAMDGLRRAA